MWHKPCRTFHPWCPCIKTRCLSSYCCHVAIIQKHLWYLIPRAIYNMADRGGIIHAQRVRQRRFSTCKKSIVHNGDIIMRTMASQITSLSIVRPSVCSGADQRKHQNSTSLAFVRGIHLWPVNSSHKGPVTQKIFSFDDVIMIISRDDRWARVFYRMQELRWNMIRTIWQLNARLMLLCPLATGLPQFCTKQSLWKSVYLITLTS